MLPRVPTLSTQCQPLLHPERAMGRQPIPTPHQAQRPVPGPRGPRGHHRARRLPQQGQHRHRPWGRRHLVVGQGAHHQVRLGPGVLQLHDQAGLVEMDLQGCPEVHPQRPHDQHQGTI